MQIFKVILAFSTFVVPTLAWAAFSPDDLVDTTKIAIADFTAANPDHVAHFTGFKAWKSDEDARVKIYVDHDGHAMEFNFTCHKHDEGIECHAQ